MPVTPRVNKSLDCGCCGDRITATPVVKSHKGSQIPHDRLVTVIRLLYALTLLMVISSLPNLLTDRDSALYCPSNHSDINANVLENPIKHFMRAHELMLRNISIGYEISSDGLYLKEEVTSAFLLHLKKNVPNILSTLFRFTTGV